MISNNDKAICIAEFFQEKYIDVVKLLYPVAYETNPQAFRLSNKKNIKIILAEFDSQLLPKSKFNLFFIYLSDANFEFEQLNFNRSEFYEDFVNYDSESHFKLHLVKKTLNNIKEADIIFDFFMDVFFEQNANSFSEYKVILKTTFGDTIFNFMKELAKDEGKEYQKHIQFPSSYYSKNAATYAFSLLDLEPIIKRVGDGDFEYQLNEAIAAYDNSLYMASCATLGVCLETVCKLIITNSGGKIKDSDATMLDKLGERLRQDKLINYKDKSRIDVCYKVRNLSSHTSPGKVTQNDCHFLINTIQSLVEQYFD